ncbi:hypothetical protein E4O00_02325 [Treponema sp. OMZ 788]|uniref:DUF6922 domain-containing protein n=1 Tax=Treponema sp. OMZ 788 TaxID=2563664 RepID=UPI0020A4B31E|nr:hypothetical protein [Treponema sp. OMZ 788]UTC65051.1 hypothetical protein E4O00_02325 [Treponema sp. OMZ 788]
MFFADYETHKKEQISQSILWEYDTKAPDWDWNIMAKTVVARVLEYGRPEDYYAMFQLYGGFEKVKNIVVQIPYLPPKELNWSCLLFDLKKEDFLCCKRTLSRKLHLNY